MKKSMIFILILIVFAIITAGFIYKPRKERGTTPGKISITGTVKNSKS